MDICRQEASINVRAKIEPTVDFSDTLQGLVLDGRVELETNTFFADQDMWSARFKCTTHSSQAKITNRITLVHTTESEGYLNCRMDSASHNHDVTPGLLYFVPDNVLQEYEFRGSTRNTIICLDVAFLKTVADQNPEFRRTQLDELRVEFRNPLLARKMSALVTLAAHQDIGWRSLSEACRLQIAVELLKSLSKAKTRGALPLSGAELAIVRDYVDAHLEQNIGLEAAAALVDRDIYGFGRAFKAATGQTFHQFITALRIASARRFLTDTDMPLSQIAYACGFSSQSHMTTVMGRHLGVTPGALRQRAQA